MIVPRLVRKLTILDRTPSQFLHCHGWPEGQIVFKQSRDGFVEEDLQDALASFCRVTLRNSKT